MKQLCISITLMAAIFFSALTNGWYLNHLTRALNDALVMAHECARDGDWDKAGDLTDRAWQQWDDAQIYLYIVLRHDEADAVGGGLREVRQLLQWEEMAEYAAANAKLVEDIRLLAEMEQFTLQNIL